MNSLQKLGVAGLISLASISNFSNANFFNSSFSPNEDYVSLEGRVSYHDCNGKYLGAMKYDRDEIGLFVDGFCVASTKEMSSNWPNHYGNLNVNLDIYSDLISGKKDYFVKLYNSQTNSIWTTKNKPSLNDESMHIFADYDMGYVPEVSTLSLLGLGALALRKSKNKSD